MAGTAIRIEMLPARLGDCLLVECLRPRRRPWRLLVDGGPPDTWPGLEARLGRLPAADRTIDLLVVTHIDSDHIGGIVPFLQDAQAGGRVREVWFNGAPQLAAFGLHRDRSVGQGESVGAALQAGGVAWNATFQGKAVAVGDAGFLTVSLPDGPTLTVLSPTATRLEALARNWQAAIAAAAAGHPEQDRDLDRPAVLGDLAALAASRSGKDSSVPNGSSIALLLEHRGASLLLGADGYGTDLTVALNALAKQRGVPAVAVDALKVPHHGSRQNVQTALITAVPARHYLVSTNGDTFHHPDDEAVARIVTAAPAGATVWFAYRTPRTERWDDPALKREHGYAVRLPAADAPGAVLTLPARG